MPGQNKSQVWQSSVCIRHSFSAVVLNSCSPTFCSIASANDSCLTSLIGRWKSPSVRPTQHVKLNASHLHQCQWVGGSTKEKYNNISAQAFEVLDDQSVCLSLILNPSLKCIKCLSLKFRPDSICESLWRHLLHSFTDALCVHMRRV